MKIVKNVDEFKKCSVIALDFETVDLIDITPIGFSMAGYIGRNLDDESELDDSKLIVGAFEPYHLPDLLAFLPDKRVTFHNFKFDGKVLVKSGFDLRTFNYDDTMIMAHLLNENEKVGLKHRAKVDLNMEMMEYDSEVADAFRNGKRRDEFLKYMMDDAISAIKLFWMYRPRIIEEELVNAYILELKTAMVVLWMELHGVKYDFDRSEKLEAIARGKLAELEDRIYEVAGRQVYLSAPNDMAAFLYDDLGIPYKEEYSAGMKSKNRSVRAEVLNDIIESLEASKDKRLPIMQDVMEVKRLNKMLSSFFESHRSCAKLYKDKRIRSSFNQVAVVTGRFASSDPNLQQLPTKPIIEEDVDTSVRATFIPEKGYKLIVADYSQIELRLAAHFSGDKNMIEGFLKGEDFHQRTVDMSGGIIDRRAAKMANFGKLYGMHPYGFAMQAKIPVDVAYKYYEEYNRMFPGVAALENQVVNNILVNGYVRLLGGRKRRATDADKLDVEGIKRVFVNSLIQGSAAIVLKMAMVRLLDEYYDRAGDIRMILQVHDELVFECKEKYCEKISQEIKDIMENVVQLKVPMVVEPIICNHYGEGK